MQCLAVISTLIVATVFQVSVDEVGVCPGREKAVSSDGLCSLASLGTAAAEKGTCMYMYIHFSYMPHCISMHCTSVLHRHLYSSPFSAGIAGSSNSS